MIYRKWSLFTMPVIILAPVAVVAVAGIWILSSKEDTKKDVGKDVSSSTK